MKKVAEAIRSDGGTALEIETDITNGAEARDAVQRTVDELGRLDTVVNNAGLMLIGPFAQAPADEWDRMLAINVRGLLHITQAAQPHLVRAAEDAPRRVADIVNISSTAGRVASAGNAVYSLTKTGVVAFTEALRKELLPQHVRVSVVEPDTVDTELGTHARADLQEAIARQTEGLEKPHPEDIADAVTCIVTRDRRVAVNELLVRAGAQTW
ncbi:SDR family NAD(P)-dependent oxidoreductase [Streptomyces sp. NPDC005244]|uniref:SDR family NAD(P)-dependent oxidoreductase n=1 Tax=Streptomyces sp. NPDC005244 TaxID=3364708 RepID=UPI0036C9263F